MISLLVTATAVIGNFVNITAVLVTILTRFRVWPPGERDWRYWLTWGCWYPATAGFFLIGLLDWGSAGVVPVSLRLIGGVATVAGVTLAFAAIRGLGVSETTGVEGELQTGGLYRYSRNPQYVGDIVMTVGWVALCDSRLTALVGVTYACYYLLLPLAEEPWLREHYGEEYEVYCDRTPRFVSWGSVTEFLHD